MTCTCGQIIQDPGRHICRDCTNTLVKNISRIPALMADLDVEVTRQAVKAASPGNSAESAGFDTFASELVDEFRRILTGIEAMIGSRPQGTTKQRVAHLVKHCHQIPKHASATGWDADLKDTIRAATKKIDVQPERTDLGACECGARIIAARGSRYAKCRHCQEVWDVGDLLDWRKEAVLDSLAGAYLPAKDIEAALEILGLPTPANTIKEWGRRGKLAASSDGLESSGGRPGKKWSVDDAIDCAERKALC